METSGIGPIVAPRRPSRSRALSAALAAALALAPPGRATASPPRIAFESETCDLGSVVQGEQPDCVFIFTNAGTEELRILQLEPTCGCTTALLSAPLTRSGDRGSIRVVFDSENFAGEIDGWRLHAPDFGRNSAQRQILPTEAIWLMGR